MVQLAGQVQVDDWVIFSGYSGAHQFCRIGAHAFIGNNTSVIRDIPPYVLATGHPAEPRSINIEGLKRRGFDETQLRAIRNAYRVLYRSDLKLEVATRRIEEQARKHEVLGIFAEFPARFHPRPRALGAARPVGRTLNIGLVAGEASGDLLGAALIEALRWQLPDACFVGVAGEHMRAASCEALGSTDELAVMGLVEPLLHLPRLIALRARLKREFLARNIDLFVRRRCAGPSIWAWRARCVNAASPLRSTSVRRCGRGARGGSNPSRAQWDMVLCLLPFEPECYAGQPVRAEFVGHTAGGSQSRWNRSVRLRAVNSASPSTPWWLPCCRAVVRANCAASARISPLPPYCCSGNSGVRCVSLHRWSCRARCASVSIRQLIAAGAEVRLLDGQADLALAAADVALVASGTATLQALLHGLPMVVAYRLAPLTAFIVRGPSGW